ncbi:hypothetical protein VV02_21435 [Luteipulveratus mongoliensis]|uniref:Uncharacterized protein n=1 Tax=Luteipulveratus mongoliensis TaxID=571913 RepID=A0A0K1JML8_9MICO|nr:hypothetical protein VV02_21435 [Luteipulveratus mongoliensis]
MVPFLGYAVALRCLVFAHPLTISTNWFMPGGRPFPAIQQVLSSSCCPTADAGDVLDRASLTAAQ